MSTRRPDVLVPIDAPLAPGEVRYLGYDVKREACTFAVKALNGTPPTLLAHLIAQIARNAPPYDVGLAGLSICTGCGSTEHYKHPTMRPPRARRRA